jgi:hypothetical protein
MLARDIATPAVPEYSDGPEWSVVEGMIERI